MNHYIQLSLISFFLLISIFSVSFAQTFSDPVDYHNFIAEEQNQITMMHMDYISHSVHSDNYEETENRRLKVIRQLQASQKKIENVPAYKGEEKLKDVSLDVLRLYHETFTIELNEANILKKDSKNSFEAMEKYFKAQDKAEAKLDHATDKFDKAQEQFAKKT